MNLTTRCPNCGTAFRVQPTQLSARGGKVRCGKCGNVFDGVTSLVADGVADGERALVEDHSPSPQLGLFEAPKKLPGSGDTAGEVGPAPEFLDASPVPRGRAAWTLAATLALVVLVVQVIFQFRSELAVQFPETRPFLAAACVQLQCELRLPRRLKLMAIESSDLQADGRRENLIAINAVLRNQALHVQEYPSLELTLTDDREEAVARRVLAPAEYLGGVAPDVVARGIAPGATVLRVYIDTSGLRAIGYRLYLFFP